MTYTELYEQIKAKKSFLCVGLDSDPTLFPECLKGVENPIFEFNKAIIDATAPYTVAYKPNTAFYEAEGLEGWKQLEMTVKYIAEKYPEILIIADAKRGDIGNTSEMYARSFFDHLNIDSVTVAPYMGEDSVTPFLGYEDKWVILLALTSNKGSKDFQMIQDEEGKPLYERVLTTAQSWASEEELMFVVGATKADMFDEIRQIAPKSFLLVPGVGAQGGSLEEVCKYGMNDECGLLVNASRAIIFADSSENFAAVAAEKAHDYQQQMENELKLRNII